MLYHNSENKIDLFIPRKFIHNVDWSSSGPTNNNNVPKNFEVSNVVFATNKIGSCIYSFPRDCKRIIINKNYDETINFLKNDLNLKIKLKSNLIILDLKDESRISNFSWFEHQFENENFVQIGQNLEDWYTEYISYVPVKPKKIVLKNNPIKNLINNNWQFYFVSEINNLKKILKLKKLDFDSEGL